MAVAATGAGGGGGGGGGGPVGSMQLLGRVVHVSACGGNSAAVSESGDVWVWGCNAFGQLGAQPRSDDEARHEPVKLAPLRGGAHRQGPVRKAARVAVGGRHMAAVTSRGELFTWGADSHGQVRSSVKISVKRVGDWVLNFTQPRCSSVEASGTWRSVPEDEMEVVVGGDGDGRV